MRISPSRRLHALAHALAIAAIAAAWASRAEAQSLVSETHPVMIRTSGTPARCLEMPHTAGARLVLAPCHGQRSQQFAIGYMSVPGLVIRGLDTVPSYYSDRVDRCVSTGADGTPLHAAACRTSGDWAHTRRGELRLRSANACLYAGGASPALRPCDGSPGERWDVVPADAPPRAGVVARVRSRAGDVPGAGLRIAPVADRYRAEIVEHQDRSGAYPMRYGGSGVYRVELLHLPPGHTLKPGDSAVRRVRVRPGGRAEVAWRVRAAGEAGAAREVARLAAEEHAAIRLRNALLPNLAHDRLAPLAQRYPDLPWLWRMMGSAAWEAARWKEAARARHETLSREPLDRDVHWVLAQHYDSLAAHAPEASARQALADSAAAVRRRAEAVPIDLCGAQLRADDKPRLELRLCPGTLAPGSTLRVEFTFVALSRQARSVVADLTAPPPHAGRHHHNHNPQPDAVIPLGDPLPEPVTGYRYRVIRKP